MNYLALDYGEHRVGVAFGDSELKMAFSRETIDQKTTNLFERLDQLVRLNKIDEFVVGMPYHPDGRKDGKNVVVEAFIKDLALRFPGMKIHTQDESYSSVQAQEFTSYMSKKSRRIRPLSTAPPPLSYSSAGSMRTHSHFAFSSF